VNADFIVLGGGIAGASCACFLSELGHVVLLEREPHFGYHASGRSAAVFSEYFGNAAVRSLTASSRSFLAAPAAELTDATLLSPRGVVALASAEDVATGRFDAELAAGAQAQMPPFEISLDEARRLCPVLAPNHYVRALCRPSVMDIDVDALHQGLLRQVRARRGTALGGVAIAAIDRRQAGWSVRTDAGDFAAPCVVNAAGAWADEVAALAGVAPIGLLPKRRTAVLVELPAAATRQRAAADWPMVLDLAQTFYFKPESGKLLVCPFDESASVPTDAQPEELDVAIAIARLEEVTTLAVRRVTHKWAGLRSFVADETPVLGQAPDADGFFWAAALGGFGIQAAPAIGRALASLVVDARLPGDLVALGLDEAMLSPARCVKRYSAPAVTQERCG
jgi:D-arginine dehydrogenase